MTVASHRKQSLNCAVENVPSACWKYYAVKGTEFTTTENNFLRFAMCKYYDNSCAFRSEKMNSLPRCGLSEYYFSSQRAERKIIFFYISLTNYRCIISLRAWTVIYSADVINVQYFPVILIRRRKKRRMQNVSFHQLILFLYAIFELSRYVSWTVTLKIFTSACLI